MKDFDNDNKNKSGKKAENVHEGHRERMRMRFLKDPDMENFADHEILELLLYNAIYRKDTNKLAHDLINAFGCFKNVLDASYEDLCAVKGMTKNAAVLIKEILPMANRYGIATTEAKPKLQSLRAAVKRYGNFFSAKNYEMAYAVLLNLNGEVLDTISIGKGSATSTDIDVNKLVNAARALHAVRVIMMHNHPSNNLYPSMADMITTNNTIVQLVFAKVALWDHIIFGNDGKYFSFYHNNIIQSLVMRCNDFLRLDFSDLYDRVRTTEPIGKNCVQLTPEEFEILEENMSTNVETRVFLNALVEQSRKKGIIESTDSPSDTPYM